MSDPGVPIVMKALSVHLNLDKVERIEGIIASALEDADNARRDRGWVIVPTIPCAHVDIRTRNDPDDAIRYCAQCGEDFTSIGV